MGFRFRKSFKLAPGIRMNVGKRGLSMSLGGRGGRVTLGSSGAYASAGIPGTGLSYGGRIGKSRPTSRRISPERVSSQQVFNVNAAVVVDDDGTVWLRDNVSNERISDEIFALAKRQHGDLLREILESGCARWNEDGDKLLGIHLGTPHPALAPRFVPKSFEIAEPTAPIPLGLGILGHLFKSVRRKIESSNIAAAEIHEGNLAQWRRLAAEHEEGERLRQRFLTHDILHDMDAMYVHLQKLLAAIEWPRETDISIEIVSQGQVVAIDVDLPEIEDMPTKQASVAARDIRLVLKDKSETQRRKEYSRHIHGVLFRIVGETFSALPKLKKVICSAYSQRAAKATGAIQDEYLLSCIVDRALWEKIDFGNLSAVEPIVSIEQFQLRRKMTATGIFTPITPFEFDGTEW